MSIKPMPIKGTPYKHQREAFIFALTNTSPGIALLMEMGTGKTITSIAIAGALHRAGHVYKLLIIAPMTILGVWEVEFSKFADFEYELKILSEKNLDQKIKTLHSLTLELGGKLKVAVINYESAWRMEAAIMKWSPDMVIADEGHKLKTARTNISRFMHRLGLRTRYRLLLTGTLVTNKAIDVYSQYKFLNPAIFGTSLTAFKNRYFHMVGYGNYTLILKKHMEPELIRRVHSIAYRVTKAECLDLPETNDVIRYVSLENNAIKLYNGIVKESYAAIQKGEITVTNILTKILRLSQLTGGFIRADDTERYTQVSSAKLSALEDLIEGVQAERNKIVIMARFIPEIVAIGKMLERLGIEYSVITGEVKDRDNEVECFQNDPEVTVFIGQIQTAALGITLTAASTMVFYSLDYSMANYEQAKARIHRVGQRNACTYIHLIAKGTIDERILKALRDKTDLAREIIDDYKQGMKPLG